MDAIIEDLRRRVSQKVELEPLGVDSFRVLTPFVLADGDHLSVILRRDGDRWLLSDEGTTLLRLTYTMDSEELRRGTRRRIIDDTTLRFGIGEADGELSRVLDEDQIGEGLYDFVQALLSIGNVDYLTREHVKSTFMEDLERIVVYDVALTGVERNWADPVNDPEARSPVDYWIPRRGRPLALFALPNDSRVRDATITLLQLEKWGRRVHSIGIYEDQELIPPRAVARFSDVVDKTFSAIYGDSGARLRSYLREAVDEEVTQSA